MHEEVLPDVLWRSRRGLCPNCGASLKLTDSGREVRCDFCGGSSQVERRLRKLEPEVAEQPLPKPQIKGATRWIRLHGARERCTCPGCGGEFEVGETQQIVRCTNCGTESKVEARMRALTTETVQGPQRRTRADQQNQHRKRIEYPWDVTTEMLCWRVINEPDPDTRLALASCFESWGFINPTTAHFLPWLLQQVQRDNDAVAAAIADAVGKLLCNEDESLFLPVLQAAAEAMLDPQGKRCIMSEVGLGPPIGIKPLLDAAEVAAARGQRDHACHALWGVNTMFGRNFPAHERMTEVVLYRMFYLTGPVLGWAVYYLQGGCHCGYTHPWVKLAPMIDEFAQERPGVAKELRRCLLALDAGSGAEYRTRLDLLAAMHTPLARVAAAENLGKPPGGDPALCERVVNLLDPMLDRPDEVEGAVAGLRVLIRDTEAVPDAVLALVRRRGESLPERVKREFRAKLPGSDLLDRSKVYYWQSEPKPPEDPEVRKLMADWDAGIRATVDHEYKLRDSLRPVRDAARERDVPIFLEDEPPTIPLKPEPPPPPPRPRPVPQPAAVPRPQPGDDDLTSRIMALQQEFAEAVMALSKRAQDLTITEAQRGKIMAEIQQLGMNLQAKIERLIKER